MKRLFDTHDIFEIRHLSDVKVSPDGRTIVYVNTVTDTASNTRRSQINLMSRETQQSTIIAEGNAPLWSPDGSQIAYFATTDGQSGIWLYQVNGGKRQLLTPVYHSDFFIDHLAESNFAWSPDGRQLAFVSTEPFSSLVSEQHEIREVNRLSYKTKGGGGRPFFADERLTHIWVIPAAGGTAELITPGDYNEHSLSWSPDGQHIAFISNRTTNPDNNQRHDLWRVQVNTKQVTRLTQGPGTTFQPRWSPDGSAIAYLAINSAISTNDSVAEDTHLYIISPDGSERQCLTKALDRRIENIQWHPGERAIFFTAGNHGTTNLYKVSLADQKIERIITGNNLISEYSIDQAGQTIAFLKSETTHPAEIFVKDVSGQPRQMTRENHTLVDACLFQKANEFWFKSFDGTPVQGWIMPPSGLKPSGKYPLILVIHGGPHNMYGYGFEPLMQLLPARGYATVFINPRGSSGYGQAFSSGNVLNWGGGDYKDLMAGIDYVIGKYAWIDSDNLGVTGQSYGGYMTNWIITQTNRFKAAVSDGGISNLISFSGTSLYHSLLESEFNGDAYDNFPLLWQWSPLRNVKNVSTPTLFLHGREDNEVPVSQAEEMFVALKKLGIETSFVQYLSEGHGWRPDLKPQNRYDLYNRMLVWFDHYLKRTSKNK